jgi:N-acetyltransferase 10
LEGELSRESVLKSMSRGQKTAGDLIPWCISQQFQNNEFASLSGARVVRIATHPELQRMGYASRALELLSAYYEGKLTNLTEATSTDNGDTKTESKKDKKDKKSKDSKKDGGKDGKPSDSTSSDGKESKPSKLLSEELAPRTDLAPVMVPLSKRPPEFLHYIGTSYGLTQVT